MREGKIATITELQEIRSKESGEPLVNLKEMCPDILCDYRRLDSGMKAIFVRNSVAGMLHQVQKRLQSIHREMQLLVVEGYRYPSYQEKYFLKQLIQESQKLPWMNFEDLLEEVHQFVALPSVAGHPTGGAVDVTLAYKGRELDMGGAIADFKDAKRLPTYSENVSLSQKERRLLLHDLMVAEGFAPFYGEWWHFSYGDREWGVFYERTKSIYSPL